MSDLRLFQGEYRGLIFGEGTPYVLAGSVNLWDTETTRGDLSIPRGDGAVPLDDFLAPRDLVLTFMVYGNNTAEAEANVHRIRDAFRRTGGREAWLRFRTHDRIWRVRCRPVRLSVPYGYVEARSHIFKVTVLLALADPRIYGDDLRTVQIPVYDPTQVSQDDGYDLDTDLPFDVDAVIGAGGEVLVANQGNDMAWPVLSVRNDGPVPLERISFANLTTGLTLAIETTLTTGQTLVANMDALVRAAPGPHIHVDGVTRYADWIQPRIPWGLESGTNRVRFMPEASEPFDSKLITARMTWRDTSA